MTVTFPQSGTILRHNISWQEFEEILAKLGDTRSSRVAYDRGDL
ncbi:MAG: hypothetical protein PX634_32070 [Microcystis sp. M53600_WE12]|jgi:hypothetical protein|nr:hypothetical protein [Microcystis sp. M53600_WE12]